MLSKFKKLAAILFASVLALSIPSSSFAIDKLHFLIGGGAGGGWDGTARGTGEALTKAGMLKGASFENMSGGGGGKALSFLINTKPENTVLVQS
ncbi:MAG: tripartite tricarboxylate transporter substrate binding protein, partial [Pelagibacteraceae bacterium]|nr:tripartite tricarboxylate transporter substrate binding protein [Pelagibacteraceae bacterium]